jgi:hypothetical protein
MAETKTTRHSWSSGREVSGGRLGRGWESRTVRYDNAVTKLNADLTDTEA